MQWLKSTDFYRKIPKDLTEGTRAGGSLSLIGALFMFILFVLEFNSYLTTHRTTEVVMGGSQEDEDLQISFNVSLPRISCEYASVDLNNILGTHKVNLTKNIRKWNLGDDGDRRLAEAAADAKDVEHEDRDHPEEEPDGDAAVSLNVNTFDTFLQGNEVTLVNFYAPWCHWSRRLAPTWEHTARLLRQEPFAKTVRIAKVDCTDDSSHAVCHKHHINAFPSILVYRDGKTHTHEHYHGDRTADAFLEFIKGLRSNGMAGSSDEARRLQFEKEVNGDHHHEVRGPKGCLLTGYVMVKRVPGNLKFTAHSTQHSFDTSKVNTSHIIHHFFFGDTFQMQRALEAIETGVLPMEEYNTMIRLSDTVYYSTENDMTQEHYVKVVDTQYNVGSKPLNTYKYTVNSHDYKDENSIPAAKFSYDLSPMAVVVNEHHIPFYHFLTSICAIIGGVFTVVGLIDSILHHSMRSIQTKVSLGKQ